MTAVATYNISNTSKYTLKTEEEGNKNETHSTVIIIYNTGSHTTNYGIMTYKGKNTVMLQSN